MRTLLFRDWCESHQWSLWQLFTMQGGEKTRSSSLCGDLKCCFEKNPLHPAGSHIYQIETKSKTISIAVGFSSICKQLSALVRVSKSSLQTTVHILCLVLRLPSSELLDEGCSLSISCKPPPPPTSPLSLPLLLCILIDGLKADYKPGLSNWLLYCSSLCGLFTRTELYGYFLYCYLLDLVFSLIRCEMR